MTEKDLHNERLQSLREREEGSFPFCIQKTTDFVQCHSSFKDAMKLWSPNNTILPEQLTPGSHKKVLWRCEQGHEWEASVFSVVMDDCRCPYCTGKRAIPGESDLATLYPDLMEQWDFEKNEGIDPKNMLPSSHEKVWWICEKGHRWQAAVFSRTRENRSNCPYCSGKKVLAGFNDLATLYPELAKQWYSPLNGDLSPTDLSPGSNKKIWWQCSDNHVWQAAVYSRTKKNPSGCPVCAGKVKTYRRITYGRTAAPVSYAALGSGNK